jgi:hypothetical protein
LTSLEKEAQLEPKEEQLADDVLMGAMPAQSHFF